MTGSPGPRSPSKEGEPSPSGEGGRSDGLKRKGEKDG